MPYNYVISLRKKTMAQQNRNIRSICLKQGSILNFVFNITMVPSVYPDHPASRELPYLVVSNSNRVSVLFTDTKWVDGVLHILLQRHGQNVQWAVITDEKGIPLPNPSIKML